MGDAPWTGRRLHFVGIGGAGMSGLALVAGALGAVVTGSDRAESTYTAALREEGIEPAIGHDGANVPGGAEVVVSTAIPGDNPELAHARDAGLRVLHRGDLLAEVAALKKSIAVAGAHGKTTTTAMIAHILRAAGRDPAYVIGGELRETGRNAAWGEGDWIVVEADESDRSFLELHPDVAVITNIELDHHATYGSEDELRAAFDEFAANARAVVEPAPADGLELRLQVPGEHNVLNALNAIAAAEQAGVARADAAAALASFDGTGRRFELVGRTASGAVVYDDYAHHPTEVQATIAAARTLAPKRVIACFQPHLYSRTRHLAKRFGEALASADVVVVLDVYPARERAEDHPGVGGRLVAAAAARASRGRPVYWLPRMDDAAALLERELRDGDLLLTLGAGDVDELARRLVR